MLWNSVELHFMDLISRGRHCLCSAVFGLLTNLLLLFTSKRRAIYRRKQITSQSYIVLVAWTAWESYPRRTGTSSAKKVMVVFPNKYFKSYGEFLSRQFMECWRTDLTYEIGPGGWWGWSPVPGSRWWCGWQDHAAAEVGVGIAIERDTSAVQLRHRSRSRPPPVTGPKCRLPQSSRDLRAVSATNHPVNSLVTHHQGITFTGRLFICTVGTCQKSQILRRVQKKNQYTPWFPYKDCA